MSTLRHCACAIAKAAWVRQRGGPVDTLIADLAAWHQSYQRLQDARQRLNEARQAGAQADTLGPLEREVDLLRQQSDACLDRLKAAAVQRRQGH